MIPKKDEILKEDSFRKHKMRNIPMYDKYFPFNPKKAQNVLECGTALWFNLNQHKQTLEQKFTLKNMYTCKDRFCPFCNWRRELKYSKMIYEHIVALEEQRKLRYIFLTLTVKNCHINDLKATIKLMQKSFERRWESSRSNSK